MKTFQKVADEIAGALLALVVTLAAIKFGTIAALPETPAIFPGELSGYLFVGLPPSVFGIIAGVILLLELLAGKTLTRFGAPEKLALLFGIAIPCGALLGAIHSPVGWIVNDYVAYFASCGALALAAKLYVGNDQKRCRMIFIEAGIAALLVSVAAIEQYFFGFARKRAFAAAEMARGIPYSAPMLAKIADTRVFATMTSANVLAGFLLLTAPLAVVFAAKAGKRLYPKAYGGQIFGIAATALTGSVFLLTKTRGAFLAALLILELSILLVPVKKIWKIASVCILLVILLAGAWFIHTQGRGFSSATERSSYIATVFHTTCEHPVAGGGWGSFFLDHMKCKTTTTDEAPRDPHNILLSFLGQCGIIGTLPVAGAILLTLLFLYRKRRTDAWHYALFFGSAAFLLHSMAELNHLIPGAWGLFGVLAVAGTSSNPNAPSAPRTAFGLRGAALLLGLGTIFLSLGLLKRDYTYSRYREAVENQDHYAESKWQDAAIAAAPDAPAVREIAGDTAWQRRDVATAEKFWREAWDISPTRPTLCRKLAAAAMARGDQSEAQMWLLKARELFPSDPGNQ